MLNKQIVLPYCCTCRNSSFASRRPTHRPDSVRAPTLAPILANRRASPPTVTRTRISHRKLLLRPPTLIGRSPRSVSVSVWPGQLAAPALPCCKNVAAYSAASVAAERRLTSKAPTSAIPRRCGRPRNCRVRRRRAHDRRHRPASTTRRSGADASVIMRARSRTCTRRRPHIRRRERSFRAGGAKGAIEFLNTGDKLREKLCAAENFMERKHSVFWTLREISTKTNSENV